METIIPTASPAAQTINHSRVSFENEIRDQQRLLNRIGLGFGLHGEELHNLIKEVSLYALYHYRETGFSLRIWCSKIMVQKCVFKISNAWLHENSQTAHATNSENRKEIPLSYKTVYLLKNIIGFNESEISILLNIDLIQVKERLAKVHHMMALTPLC